MQDVKINVDEIPDCVADDLAKCILEAIKKSFEKPEVQADYEKWLKEHQNEDKGIVEKNDIPASREVQ